MPAPKPVTCHGKTYRSASEVYANCEAAVSYPTFVRNLRSGITPEKALKTFNPNGVPIIYQGKKYSNIRELTRIFGVNSTTFADRLALGWSIAQALGHKPSIRKSCVPYTYRGKKYESRRALCKTFSVKEGIFRKRMAMGWSIAEALGVKTRRYAFTDECIGYVYKIANIFDEKVYIGMTAVSLKERFARHISDAQAGSSIKLHRVMRDLGPDVFKIELLAQSTSRSELLALEEKAIVEHDSIKHGYNTLSRGNFGSKGKSFKYKGKDYRSLRAIADAHQVLYEKFKHLVSTGCTIRQALSRCKDFPAL